MSHTPLSAELPLQTRPRNLYEAMDPIARDCLVSLLGFHVKDAESPECCGFRITLKDIPAPAGHFTIGDALRMYCAQVSMHVAHAPV